VEGSLCRLGMLRPDNAGPPDPEVRLGYPNRHAGPGHACDRHDLGPVYGRGQEGGRRSEVHLTLETRVELQAYRDQVLSSSVPARVAVEHASTLGWNRYVGDGGVVIGIHTFGTAG
jgi:hypothetical protein